MAEDEAYGFLVAKQAFFILHDELVGIVVFLLTGGVHVFTLSLAALGFEL